MCFASDLQAVDAATVGVLGFLAADHTPRACAVTPYVVAGVPTVTSTLALLTKVKAVRANPRVALLAGGTQIGGAAAISVHLGAEWFDAHLRTQERRKYPPARLLLSLPFHRRYLWWYVGRAVIGLPGATPHLTPGSDRVTLTVRDGGGVRIIPLAEPLDVAADRLVVGDVPDGPACLLVHEEESEMTQLRQLTLRGAVHHGVLTVSHRSGSLARDRPTTLGQLRQLRALGRAAAANRPLLQTWSVVRDAS